MYNEKRKQEYLSNVTEGSIDYTHRIFEMIAVEEEFRGKDICEFTETEIFDMYKGFNTPSYQLIVLRHGVLNRYTAWCESENLIPTNMNCFKGIQIPKLYGCINYQAMKNTYVSYDQLNEYCDVCESLGKPEDAYLLQAIWEGLDTTEILRLKIQEVFDDHIIIEGKDYPVKSQFRKYALHADAQDSYTADFSTGMPRSYKYLPSEYILKPTQMQPEPYKKPTAFIRRRLEKIRRRVVLESTFNSIQKSGLFHYIREISNGKKDVKYIQLKDNPEFQIIMEKYHLTDASHGKIRNIFEEFNTLYEQ